MGADIPRSTLADWCGHSMRILQPVLDQIEASVLDSDILHADDTPIRVLAPERRAKGIGKGVKQSRIWAYVCDQRPCDLIPIFHPAATRGRGVLSRISAG